MPKDLHSEVLPGQVEGLSASEVLDSNPKAFGSEASTSSATIKREESVVGGKGSTAEPDSPLIPALTSEAGLENFSLRAQEYGGQLLSRGRVVTFAADVEHISHREGRAKNNLDWLGSPISRREERSEVKLGGLDDDFSESDFSHSSNLWEVPIFPGVDEEGNASSIPVKTALRSDEARFEEMESEEVLMTRQGSADLLLEGDRSFSSDSEDGRLLKYGYSLEDVKKVFTNLVRNVISYLNRRSKKEGCCSGGEYGDDLDVAKLLQNKAASLVIHSHKSLGNYDLTVEIGCENEVFEVKGSDSDFPTQSEVKRAMISFLKTKFSHATTRDFFDRVANEIPTSSPTSLTAEKVTSRPSIEIEI